MQPNRLFFALLPPAETCAAIEKATRDLSIMLPHGGKVIAPANLHLTLMFLGDAVAPGEEAAALQAASTISGSPFTFSLDHAAAFAQNPTTWWLGTRQPDAALLELRNALHARLLEARVSYDRQRFVPHVTIVRHAKSRLASTTVRPIFWIASSFHLMRSPMEPRGAVYESIGSWPLRVSSTVAAGQLPLL